MNMSPWQSPWSLRASAAAALVALATLSGCAALNEKTPEQQVRERAGAYWKARASADAKAAYALLAPSYRNLNSEQDFTKKYGVGSAIQGAEIAKVNCEAEKCIARVALKAKPPIPGFTLPALTTYLDDTWVLDRGQWWRFEAP